MKKRISVASIFFFCFLILGLIIIPSCKHACVEWEFNTDGDGDGWQIDEGITLEVLDGKLIGEITQPNGYWIGPDDLDIDATVYKSLEMRYRIDSVETPDVAYFYWIKAGDSQFGNDRRIKFEVQTDNTWQDISVDLAQSVNWDDVIKSIRLDPVLFSGSTTVVEYDYIRLCK